LIVVHLSGLGSNCSRHPAMRDEPALLNKITMMLLLAQPEGSQGAQ
jgi:hypothetical protein